ncbi:hypothetical protein ACS0TY_032210 [Phlomoides rotata]
METPKKRMKQKEDEKEGFDKRSALRNLHLNRLQFHKSRTNKCSNLPVPTTGDEDSATSVKTPPVEASVSPETQCGSHSKMVGLKSSATPVCYGAGHLPSGVSDKRKISLRGSLRGGCEKVDLFDDEHNVISNSQDSSSPVLAKASVLWLLPPCDEEGKMIHGNASFAFDLMSSPSTFCGNVSDLACKNRNYSGSLLDDSEFNGFLVHSNKKLESLLAVNSISTSNCDAVSSGDGKYVRHNVIENSSAFSVGSLSSGNIIQTPNSDSSTYEYVGWDAQHKDVVQFEIDSITETLNDVSMSPRSVMSIRDALCDDLNSSADSIFPIRLQKNVDSVCSWVSDPTLESLALSQARMSWRDGLLCKFDESDCTPCLSDEQNDGVGCSGKQIKSCQLSQSGADEENDLGVSSCLRSHLGIEFRENEDNAAEMNLDASPILLEYEPCVSVRGKEKLSEDIHMH